MISFKLIVPNNSNINLKCSKNENCILIISFDIIMAFCYNNSILLILKTVQNREIAIISIIV